MPSTSTPPRSTSLSVYLVRHAKAGQRGKWDGPDELRPLSRRGWRQADELVALLADKGVGRVLSSPFRRCVQTVEPLAATLDLRIEHEPALAEGADDGQTVALVRTVADTSAVLCTHGDLVPVVLDALARDDGVALPPDYPYEKGSTWELEHDGTRFVAARYLQPPPPS